MTRSVPDGEVRFLGDRAFLIGVADPAAGRDLARALEREWPRPAAVEVVCGYATVMVSLAEPDVELGAVRAVALQVYADSRERRHRPSRPFGPHRDSALRLRRTRPRRGGGLRRVLGRRGGRSHDGAAVDRVRGRVLAGLRLPRRAARAPARGATARPASPRGSGRLGGARQRTRRRLPDRIARRVAARRPHRLSALVAGAASLRRAGAGRPGPVQRGGRGRPARARAAACTRRGPRRRGPGRVLEVVAPGLRAVVQDGGRRGVAAVGVPSAGPADPVSFALANALVGNATGSGALELTGGGTRLRALAACHVAVVGAAPGLRLDGSTGAGRAGRAPGGRAGARGGPAAARMPHLPVGRRRDPRARGVREQRERRADRARPRPARTGARLDAGPLTPPLGDHLTAGAAVELDEGGAPVELRVVPGPHPEQFAPGALAAPGRRGLPRRA